MTIEYDATISLFYVPLNSCGNVDWVGTSQSKIYFRLKKIKSGVRECRIKCNEDIYTYILHIEKCSGEQSGHRFYFYYFSA